MVLKVEVLVPRVEELWSRGLRSFGCEGEHLISYLPDADDCVSNENKQNDERFNESRNLFF